MAYGMAAGFVPFASTCVRCGKFVMEAGMYIETEDENSDEFKAKVGAFHKRFLCPECEQHRRRMGQTKEQFISEAIE